MATVEGPAVPPRPYLIRPRADQGRGTRRPIGLLCHGYR